MDPVTALRARREALGLTREELADRAGVNASTIAKMEAGINSPTLTTVQLLLNALGCEMTIAPKEKAAGR